MAIASLGTHAEKWAEPLEAVMIREGITPQLEKAHFITQLAYESMVFVAVEENLNYSAKGLQEVFHKYFKTTKLALDYARNPRKIANRVYANRMGNGDEASGDGYEFRGRSPIMLTGRNNYTAASMDIFGDRTLIINPDLAAMPETGAKICAWFWIKNGCKKYALEDNLLAVSGLINVGKATATEEQVIGWEGRKKMLVRVKKAFNLNS